MNSTGYTVEEEGSPEKSDVKILELPFSAVGNSTAKTEVVEGTTELPISTTAAPSDALIPTGDAMAGDGERFIEREEHETAAPGVASISIDDNPLTISEALTYCAFRRILPLIPTTFCH